MSRNSRDDREKALVLAKLPLGSLEVVRQGSKVELQGLLIKWNLLRSELDRFF